MASFVPVSVVPAVVVGTDSLRSGTDASTGQVVDASTTGFVSACAPLLLLLLLVVVGEPLP